MTNPSPGKVPKTWIPMPVLCCLGVALVIASLFGASWVLRNHNDLQPEVAPESNRIPAVVAIGFVDVEGGVISLYPAVPGRVTEVAAIEDKPVKADAVLLRLDDQAARSGVQEAEAGVRAAQAQHAEALKAPRQHQLLVEQQKAAIAANGHDLAAARLVSARKARMLEQNLLSREEAEAAEEMVKKLEAADQAERAKLQALELHNPGSDVTRAEADVSARKAVLDRARHVLEEHALKAPVDGTVLRVLVHAGEVLGPQPRQPAFLIIPGGPRIVRAEVEQEFAARVAVDQEAEIQDDTRNAGPTWKGRVVRLFDWFGPRRTVLPDALPVQDVRTLECLIRIEPDQPPLRIGQRVRVKLFDNTRRAGLQLKMTPGY